MNDLNFYNSKLSKTLGVVSVLTKQQTESKSKKEQLQNAQQSLEKAQVFIQTVAQQTQEQLRFHLQDIVQLAMDAVFPGEYEFNVIFEIKRGQTEARLVFMKNGFEVDPIDASGGGVAELAAFSLRIATWTLGKTDNVMLLDEPFKAVSLDVRPRAIEILKELSEKLNLQMIIITHDPAIVEMADKVFEVKLVNNISKVKELV
jgi:DNA repair exonuclease SbcCD ATPase subunit